MKKSVLPLLILAAMAFSCSRNQAGSDPSIITDSETLLKYMPDPPSLYRAAPLWDWNDKINREEIEFQMNEFKKGGIGGVFVHPRPGLVTDYLSEDWHQLFKFTLDVAKKLDMQVWIYDENSYPSGFAGGHVQARYPDSYRNGTGLGLIITADLREVADLPVEVLLKKSGTPARPDAKPEFYVFYRTDPKPSYWYGGFPYVDLLYPGVTDTFMRATMEGYEKYNREDFGKSLPGIFTDEPNLEAAKGPNTVLRWTPDLFDEFEARFGYRLEPELVSLVEETDNYTQVRHDYYTLILELFLDRWAVPWFEYCQANGLGWTGHYWEHGWPYPGDGIDESAFYMYHQVPGIDMLGRAYDSAGLDQQFGNTRAVRELASAANQAGWRRRLSETWGGAGWQISFAELKHLVDWEVVLGVNLVNPHLSYYSMQGVRKFDYPPSFSYQEPWWQHFSLLGDYTGRISMAMSAGQQVNHILVLQPNTTAWMYHSSVRDDRRIHRLSTTFKKFIQSLEQQQFEYDLGSEQVLRRFGENNRKGLRIRERIYDHVVIPPGMRNIDRSTLGLLKKYLADGFTVLSLSDSLDYLDGEPSSELRELAEKYPVNWIRGQNERSEHVRNYFIDPEVLISQTDTTTGQLFHQRRVLDDGQLLFLVNSDLKGPARVKMEMKGRRMQEVSLLDGRTTPVEGAYLTGKLRLDLAVEPGGSRLFLIYPDLDSKSARPGPDKPNARDIPSDEPVTAKRLESNVLTIDYLDLQTRNFRKGDLYFMNAMYKLFELSGLKTGNPWQHKIQYRQQYLEMDHFGEETWFKATYRFQVSELVSPETLAAMEAVIERPDQWKVTLNGKEIRPADGKWWLDRHFPVYPIGEAIKAGENIIVLSAPKMTVFSEIMPVYILGDFNLSTAGKGFTIIPAGSPGIHSWKESGMPFYSGQVSYSKTFRFPDKAGTYTVNLGTWSGSVAEVLVDGVSAGKIGWAPYSLDISKLITGPQHRIEVRLTGTLKNTLGYHHVIQRGWIDSPWSWNQAPESQPAGSDYQFLDYGLFGDFTVSVTE